jgi:hypothetical protein
LEQEEMKPGEGENRLGFLNDGKKFWIKKTDYEQEH